LSIGTAHFKAPGLKKFSLFSCCHVVVIKSIPHNYDKRTTNATLPASVFYPSSSHFF